MPTMQGPPGPETIIDGRRYRYFAGTGYLGLQGHPALVQAACAATQQYGMGSATSRSGFGDMPPTLAVERLAAKFCGHEEAFYFPSGFMGANIFCRALAGLFNLVLIDEAAHYAITEAAQMIACPMVAFKHRDVDHLRELLRQHAPAAGRTLLMSDGVFAATGAIAPVSEYRAVLETCGGGTIYLDDAHALGVIGERGRGAFEYAGCDDQWNRLSPIAATAGDECLRLYSSGTLSKAFGTFGGIAAGSSECVALLKQSPFFNGATPPLPAVAAAAAAAIELVMSQPGLRQQLWANSFHLKRRLKVLGLPIDETPVPIVPIVLESRTRMQKLQQALWQQGIAISYFARYAGLGEEGGLRIAVFANHTPAMIDELADNLARLL